MAIRNADDRAFMQKLYTNNERLMYRVALRMTHDSRDADDVVSATCESLIKRIHQLKSIRIQAHPAYIASAVRNQALMLLRRRRSEHRAIRNLIATCGLPEDVVMEDLDARLYYKYTLAKVVKAIQKLPDNDQNILRMKFFDQLSDQDIAELLNLLPSSVRTKVTRARRRLREALKEDADGR